MRFLFIRMIMKTIQIPRKLFMIVSMVAASQALLVGNEQHTVKHFGLSERGVSLFDLTRFSSRVPIRCWKSLAH